MRKALAVAVAVAVLAVLAGVASPAQAQNACNTQALGHAGVSRTTSTHDSITLYWDEHSRDGRAAQGYYVRHRVKGGDWILHQAIARPLGGSTRSFTITGLEPDTDYDVHLGYLTDGTAWYMCGVIFHTGTEAAPAPAATVKLRVVAAAFPESTVEDGVLHVPESSGIGGSFTLAALMSSAPAADTEFTLEVAGHGDNKPTNDVDYEYTPADTSFTVPAGKLDSEAKKIQFRFRCDNESDPGEIISLRLVGDTISSDRILIQITDDCHPGSLVKFTETSYSGEEGDRVAVTLRSERAAARAYTVNVTASDGTGSADDDIDQKSWEVLFPAGDPALLTFYVDIEDDSVVETSAETITLRIEDGAGYSVGSPGEAVLTIAGETPDPVSIGFNPTMYTVTEGVDSRVVLTVKRDGGSTSRPVPFTVTATDAVTDEHRRRDDEQVRALGEEPSKARPARAGTDYTATVFHGTIGAGESSATVHVPITDDRVAEDQEPMYVELEADSADGFSVTKGTALVSILDNDVVQIRPGASYLETGEFTGRTDLSVSLDNPFDENRTITLEFSTDDPSIAVVEPSTVEVSGADWNDPVTVTVKAVPDPDHKIELTNVRVGLQYAPVMVAIVGTKIPVLASDPDLSRLPETEACSKSDACKGSFYAGPAIGRLGVGLLSPRIYLSEPAPQGGVTFTVEQVNTDNTPRLDLPERITVPRGAQNIIYNVTLPKNGDTFLVRLTPVDESAWVPAWQGADTASLHGVGSTGGL